MTIEDIMAEADSAIDSEEGKEPEEEQQETLESLMAQADKQIEEESPAPSRLLAPEPISELDALQAKAPTPKPQKEEAPPEDAVDLLLQMTQGQTPDQYDEKVFQWRDTLTPKQFSKLSKQDPTFPMTDTQERAAYDYLRKNEDPFKIPRSFEDWYGIAEYTGGIIPMVGEQVKDSAVGFVKGGYKFGSGLLDYATAENYAWKDAYETLPDDAKERVREQLGSIPGGFFNPKALADAEISKIVFSELPQEEQKKFEEQSAAGTEAGRTAMFSALEPLVGLPISMAETAVKVATGGTSIWDRITETAGARSYEDSFENWRNRRQFDGSMQRWNAERPTSYAKFLEVISPAIVSIAKLDGPNVEDYMREEGLTREEAELARDYDVEQRVLASINQVQEGIPDIDEDQRIFGEFALPGGFGLDQFGYAMNVMRVGSWMTPKLYAKLKLAGKTPEEINEYYTARTNAAKESAKKQLERRSKPTVAGKVAGKAADQIERIQAAMNQSAFWKRIRQASPYIAGGAVGYGITEDPLAFLYGPIAGRLATSFPRFISDWDEARRISAGGRQGTFATLAEIRQDRANASRGKPFDPEAKPEIKLKGSISERIQDYGGEKVDNILGNIGDYVRMGVEPTLIGIGVGAINSSDDEELASMIGNGLFFSLGGRGFKQIQNKILGGYDPVIEGRKLRQDMVDLQKLYRDSSPESRKQIDRLSDWNTVVAAKEREVAAAQKRLQEAQANAEKAAAGDPTRFRTPADTIAEVGAASDKVVAAKKALELRQATLDRVSRANEQTRNEYSRQWLRNLARINMLGNGTLREGMNNVGINVLSSAEIYKIMRRNPENASISNEALWQSATQSGFHSSPDGTTVFKPGSPLNEQGGKMTFDSKRPSIVVNADYIRQTAGQTGQLPIFALNHEFGHHLKNVPEYAELIRDSESMLFAQDIKDLSGNTVAVTPGKYSQSDLVDMYWNRYLAGYTRAEKTQFAQMNGLLDETTGQLKPEETAAYMRNEVMADLTAESVSRFIDPQKDGAIKDIYDRALLKFRTKKLANLVDKLRRLGGTGDVISDNTGAELSPELVQTATDALKAYDALKNQVSPAVPQAERPKISRAQMMGDRAVQARYGSDSPLFSTSVKAQVFDTSGKPIGTSIPIDMKDPALSEGVWERTETGVKQIGGYGRLSRQIDLAGVPIGSRIVISNQLDYQPDGVTPIILNPKQAKKRGKDRFQIVRSVLDNTPDYGAPNRFQPVAPGSDTYRGTFTPLQMKALMEIPESVVPKSIKEKIIAINTALARNDGTRMIVDYAAVMTDSGKYQAFSPKVYDVVPIGMMFSKDGNFLATTISVTRLFDKLNAWSERMPARLDFWNGSKDRFWDDFSKKYLANWQKGIEGSGYTKKGELVEGSIPLDADAEIAQQKANIFNDFLNLFDNATEGLNPDRTETPRRKGDPKDKNIDRTIMSMRIDHIAEIMENPMGKLPIIYKYAKQNFLPKPKSKKGSSDEKYFELLQDPEANREKLQKMVDDAAKSSGYRILWHGPSDPEFRNLNNIDPYLMGWFTNSKQEAATYSNGGPPLRGAVKIQNPIVNKQDPNGEFRQDWRNNFPQLENLGYDAIYNEIADAYIPFRPSQIESADPVTRDDQGNIIPLSQRFDSGSTDIRFLPKRKALVTPEENARFMELAKNPEENQKQLRQMVDDVASDAQYYGPLYHQTRSSEPFSEFDNIVEGGVKGIYAADIEHIESRERDDTPYGDSEIEVYVKINNPLTENDLGFYKGDQGEKRTLGNVVSSPYDPKWIARMQSKGYDGIVWDGPSGMGQIVVAFDSSQIKKADPVTYDDQGNVIPLSQRFQSASSDIRYLPRKKIEGEEMPFKGKIVTQNRDPVLQQAAQRLIRGEIDTAEYQDLVRDRSPYEDLPDVPEPMTTEAMKDAIAGESRKEKVGIVRDVLKQNDEAESRIDIKAFENFGEYVATIHKPTKKEVGGEAAPPIAHESTVHLKDVKFMVNPTQSLMIAAGRSKGTIARINGKWQDTTPEGAFELANEKFNDPEWVQLGMNPTRQSNFYVRSTGEPVKSADEVIQVGKFVLAKNPKKVTPEEMPERTMTDYGMQFLPRPKKADEGERKVPALSGVEPPVRFVGPRNTALEGVTLEYEPEAKPLTGISFLPRPKTDRYKFSFTVASDRIKLVDDLIKAKDWQGIRDLNQATVRHAMSDLRGVNYTIKDVLGAFENGREVSALVEVNTPDPEMVAEVRKRMVALGELWKQTEVLEEKVGMGDIDLLGTIDNDGFLHIGKYELEFDKLTSRMVEKARLAAGIQSMTIDGNNVIFYDTDNIGAGFAKRIGDFTKNVTENGGVVRGSSRDNAAVRSYRDPESVKAGSLYYTDDPVQLFGAGQLPDRLRSPVYRVVSELLGRPLPPPKDGKRSYFVKEDVTPKQVKLQNAIGNTQDRVVLNDRKNKDVVKAYEELNSELIKQYDALVAAGMRFEALNDYDAYSKIYPNSSAVIKDIRNNNQLMFLKTNPQTFGPMKDGKPMDFSFHPLLKDSGRTDSSGNKLNYNDILRVVHDAIAHGTYSVEFGPIGEESAWHTHIRTIDNPWARWALTMETRGQNSFVNYRDARIGKDKMPLKPGDNGYVPIPDRDYAEQKFALIPLKYSLTGDAKVDKPVKELMAQLGKKRAEGSAEKQPDWMPSKAEAKQVLSKVPQPAGDPKTMVADATAVMGKPTKADEASSVPVIVSKEWKKKKEARPEYEGIDDDDDGDTITVGEAQLKDVVKYELTGLPIVVRPLPNYAAANNATKVAKNVLNIAERPEQYKEYSDRVVAAGEKVRNDPQRFTTLSGYLEFMRESGASGNLLMPPTQLVELVKNAQSILNLWNGGYHGAKTAPGTVKAAKEGLDGVNEMKSLMTENGVNLGPTPMITALHHLWGILSRQLDPLNQEGMWMRLVSQPSVLKQIQRSIDGEYNLSREQWKEIVQRARRNTKGQYDKIGNNATANANSFALMLERHNGKWDQLASIYRLDDPVAMTNAFWGLNVGPTGIKNKVQRFIGLTFGIHGSVLDRWRFVSLNLPMAMKLTGKPIPESYFKYYGRNKTIPEDPVGIYKSYGTVENGNPVYSTALYTGIDRTIEGVIANSPDIRNFLGVHATPGGFHWVDWNTVKNEAVGHSSLDLTKEFLKQKGRDATVEDFLDVVQNSTVYTRADQDGKILDLVMENGVFRIRED